MPRKKPSDPEREFTLVLTGINGVTTETEDALFEAGCDDATVSLRSGVVSLVFSRAASLKDAMLSAINDVRKAKIGADVLRIDVCTLVTQADVARKIDRSTQLVRQYASGVRGPGGFPAPVRVSDDSSLWLWSEVAQWLRQNDMIPEEVLREANEAAAINSALALEHQRRQNPALAAEVLRSFAELRMFDSA